MSSKEIKISPELFNRKQNKTLKKPTGKQLKRELLQRLSQGSDLIPVSYTHLTLPTIYSV